MDKKGFFMKNKIRYLFFYYYVLHHAKVFVVENMAVVHPHPGAIVEAHRDLEGRVHRDIDGVFPLEWVRERAVGVLCVGYGVGYGAAAANPFTVLVAQDIAGLELYLPLLVGGRVVIAGQNVESDGRELAELLDRSGATVMQATPATWNLLMVQLQTRGLAERQPLVASMAQTAFLEASSV